MRSSRVFGALLLSSFLAAGCGGKPPPVAPAPPPVAPPPAPPPAPPAPAEPDPFAVPESNRDDSDPTAGDATPLTFDAWEKARKAKGVGPRPAACAAYAKRTAPKSAPAGDLMANAFAEKDPAKRDALLVAQEKLPQISAASIRSIRADLAPVECADSIVDPYLEKRAKNPTEGSESMRMLVGHSLAGRLARTALTPPTLGKINDKEKIKAFIAGPLKTWLVEQSNAIELLASGAAGLSGYARGIAAVQAGIAEMRLVDKIRNGPVPASWDPELKSVYEAALDEALEPRKKRGRDAALVGMSDFARAGILRDARIDNARALLTKLYGGRRIDALDSLMLPPPPVVTVEGGAAQVEAIIANAPALWLGMRDLGLKEDGRVLSKGVTRALRERFSKLADGAPDDLRSPYARARFDMGRLYWRRLDFVEAAHAAKGSAKPDDRLVLALSVALAKGPNGAAEMMRAATPAALDLRHTEALDALVAENGPLAGMAAYDAAHLRALSPPDEGATEYLTDVAARFRKAETLLTDPGQKKQAAQRATEIDGIIAAAAKKP